MLVRCPKLLNPRATCSKAFFATPAEDECKMSGTFGCAKGSHPPQGWRTSRTRILLLLDLNARKIITPKIRSHRSEPECLGGWLVWCCQTRCEACCGRDQKGGRSTKKCAVNINLMLIGFLRNGAHYITAACVANRVVGGNNTNGRTLAIEDVKQEKEEALDHKKRSVVKEACAN